MTQSQMSSEGARYWEERKNLIYYQVMRMLVEKLGASAESMLDVGSGKCPYLEWFPGIQKRTSLDMRNPYAGPGIEPIKADFLRWEPVRRYDLVTCMQVLEHIPDAKTFSRRLLAVSEVLVVSVPYKWPKDHTKSHIHDPVDEDKLVSWFGRKPNYTYMCREITANVRRIIQVYDRFDQPWKALNQREKIIAKISAGSSTTKDRPGLTQ